MIILYRVSPKPPVPTYIYPFHGYAECRPHLVDVPTNWHQLINSDLAH